MGDHEDWDFGFVEVSTDGGNTWAEQKIFDESGALVSTDEGLKYAYSTNYLREGAWKVSRVPYNAPGMLVWYRDTTYGNLNLTLNNLSAGPSFGTKGGLLIVDSHFDPLRRKGVG